jgi:regulatory protein
MSTITSLEAQKKDKERCNVYIDGTFYCGIKLEIAVKYRLKVGMEIEKSFLDEIQLETEKAQALDKATAHIAATMKTKSQLTKFLQTKGYTQAVIDYVIDKLTYYGYIDDYAYCRTYVNSVNGKGKKIIERDLIKRGAERDAIEQALDLVEEDEDEVLAIANKYMRGKEFTKENLYKTFKYLMSKGYDYEIAKSAIEKLGRDDEDN